MPAQRLSSPARSLIITVGIAAALFLMLFAWRVAGFYRAIKHGDLAMLPQFSARLTRSKLAAATKVDPEAVSRGTHPTLGNTTSTPLTVVLFADFECPFSKEVYGTVRSLFATQPNARLVFRQFPLSDIHPYARPAAAAALCADRQGKFWPLHDKLFQNAPRLEPQDIRFAAEQIGLDLKKFDVCLGDPAIQDAINTDLADGAAAGVHGTPTFFFNGNKVEGAIPMPIFRQILDSFEK